MSSINYWAVLFSFLLFLSACSSGPRETYEEFFVPPVAERYYAPNNYPDRIMQSVSDDPARQINISWRTSGNIINGFVEYKPLVANINEDTVVLRQDALLKQVRYDNIHDHYFKASITELEPESDYMIRVGNRDYRSEWISLSTAADSFRPFRFLYFADFRDDVRGHGTALFRHASNSYSNIRFMIHAGGLVNNNANDNTWGEWFHAGGWLFQEIPSLPVAGNNDHIIEASSPSQKRRLSPQWRGTFHVPQNGPAGMENLSYYFDYPGMRVVALYSDFESLRNNNVEVYLDHESKINQDTFNQQLIWLKRILAANTQPWLVVVLHHPVFTARKDRHNELFQKELLPLLEKYNVDLVLQGNDLVYARGSNPEKDENDKKRDLPVYVISVAGKTIGETDPSHSWIKKYREDRQLYQVIHVNRNSLRFESIDVSGRLADRFWIRRSDTGNKTLVQ